MNTDSPLAFIDRHTARRVLLSFISTFVAARVIVILIMTRRMPDLFLHVGSAHVHHLNYGIFILSLVGGALLLIRLSDSARHFIALMYGVGLALTFDEFGMWLHLGGSYWQRASYDAVVTIASLLALLIVAPTLRRFRPRHWLVATGISVCAIAFAGLLIDSVRSYAHAHNWPSLKDIEVTGPQ